MSKNTSIYKSTLIKLPLMIALAALATGLVSSYFSKRLALSEKRVMVGDTAKLVLTDLNRPVYSFLRAGDVSGLQDFIKQAGNSDLIASVRVCSDSGKVIASSIDGDTGQRCAQTDTSGNYTTQYRASAPVYNKLSGDGQVMGVMELAVSESYFKNAFSSFHLYSMRTLALFTFILGSLIVVALYRTVLSPLKIFRGALTRITSGDYDAEIDYRKDDELGEFADALNNMSSEIKAKQSQLEMSNKHFSEYIRAMDESAIIIRSSIYGKITYANSKYYEITGTCEEDTIGRSILELRGEMFDSDDILEYWDTILKNFLWKGVIAKKNKNGKTFYVNATVCPIVSTDGEVIELIDIWHDVTEIYELKEELSHHKDNLEEIVVQRTEELKKSENKFRKLYEESKRLNTELMKAQSTIISQEKLASIGHLAAGIAHELNNPMGFVSSNFEVLNGYFKKISIYIENALEALEKYAGNESQAEAHKTMEVLRQSLKLDFIMSDTKAIFSESSEGFSRISSIINSLRDFSRIDHENKMSGYNLNEGLKSTLTISKNETKYIAGVETDLGDIPDIECNGGEINQVLLNIIINASQAIKDSAKDFGKISVKTFATEENVHCIIKDDGIGISQETIDKIFDPFFTTRPPGQGTGLGLSISYDIIVNKHKGNLTVDSDQSGTAFEISLPLKRGVRQEEVCGEIIN